MHHRLCRAVQELNSPVLGQLTGGFRCLRSRRTAVIEPSLPKDILLNPGLPDDIAIALPHIVRGQWLERWILVKVVGSGLAIRSFYRSMRRLGNGLKSHWYASIPHMLCVDRTKIISRTLRGVAETAKGWFPAVFTRQRIKMDESLVACHRAPASSYFSFVTRKSPLELQRVSWVRDTSCLK